MPPAKYWPTQCPVWAKRLYAPRTFGIAFDKARGSSADPPAQPRLGCDPAKVGVTGSSPVGGAMHECRSDKGKRAFQIGLLVGLAPPMHPKGWQANAEVERAAELNLA